MIGGGVGGLTAALSMLCAELEVAPDLVTLPRRSSEFLPPTLIARSGGLLSSLRRLVEILPQFKNKRQAVDIFQQIESDVSAYLFTITIMNLAVGVATGTVMALCGVGDPVLWGTVAFLLNYIPILGPMIGVVVFVLAGLLSITPLWGAFLPAGL